MTPLLVGLASAWAVLRLCGVDRRWPWRFSELETPRVAAGSPGGGVGRLGRRPWATRPRVAGTPRVPAVAPEPERDLPRTIELLRLALSAGHTPHTAVAAIAPMADGPVGEAFAAAAAAARDGLPLLDALEVVRDRAGPATVPLVTAISVSLASGAPLAPALERLGAQERRRQRRRAEQRIRRLPVLLLGPLVGLILPAFVALTIVPVLLTVAPDLASRPSG
jgi:hypothetical protein